MPVRRRSRDARQSAVVMASVMPADVAVRTRGCCAAVDVVGDVSVTPPQHRRKPWKCIGNTWQVAYCLDECSAGTSFLSLGSQPAGARSGPECKFSGVFTALQLCRRVLPMSICLSVCLPNAWIVTKRNKCLPTFLYRVKGQFI